jgi:elongation factor P
MPKASELKRGMVIEIKDIPHMVKKIESRSPSSRGASTIYKIRFTNLQTGQKLDESYKSDDLLKEGDCTRERVQFSYMDGDAYVFMDTEDYSQHTINGEDLEGQAEFLTEGLEGISMLFSDGVVLGIELPTTVSLEIIETDPSIKGASASSRTKPARFVTGLEIQVPEYLETGEVIKINTSTHKFSSRA